MKKAILGILILSCIQHSLFIKYQVSLCPEKCSFKRPENVLYREVFTQNLKGKTSDLQLPETNDVLAHSIVPNWLLSHNRKSRKLRQFLRPKSTLQCYTPCPVILKLYSRYFATSFFLFIGSSVIARCFPFI